MRIPDISANRAFLSAVMKGAIPDELVHAAEGGEVHVDMEDHKEEEFVKPKVRQKAAFTMRRSAFDFNRFRLFILLVL